MNDTETNRNTENTRYGNTIPCIRLNEKLQILSANGAAKDAGVREGEFLPCPSHRENRDFLLMHEVNLRHAEETVTDALSAPQYATRIHIANFHGFHVACLVYEYALSGNTATAYLFRSVRKAVAHAPHLSCATSRHATLLESYFSRLREKCTALMQAAQSSERDGEPFDGLLPAALFATRILTPPVTLEAEETPLFFIGALLRIYRSTVFPSAFLTDCRIVWETLTEDEDISLPVDVASMCLLWTAVLKILSDVSDDRAIRISQRRCGEDCEICFTTVSARLTSRMLSLSSPAALLPHIPQAHAVLLLIDHLTGVQNCFTEILSDTARNALTVSLYIPAKVSVPDFKSPALPHTFWKEITAVCKTVLSLSLDM